MSLNDLNIPCMKYDDFVNRNACFDEVKCIDLVLVFDELKNDYAQKRRSFFKILLESGFELRYCEHTKYENLFFIFVHAPIRKLYEAAEKTRYKVPIERNTLPKTSELRNCLDYVWIPFELSDEIDEAFVYNSKLNDVRNKIYFTAAYNSQWKHKFLNFWREENLGDLGDFMPRKDRSLLTYEILSRVQFEIVTLKRTVGSYISLLRFDTKNGNSKSSCSRSQQIFTEIGLENLLDTGVFKAVYPLHEPLERKTCFCKFESNGRSNRQLLWEYWSKPKNVFRYQPIFHIKQYFGEKVAFYFSWLGFYTSFLIIPSIASLIVVLYGVLRLKKDLPTIQTCDINLLGNLTMCPLCEQKTCTTWKLSESCIHTKITNMFDNSATVGFSILMGIWNVFFINYWKRQQNESRFEWDMIDYENKYDIARPDYERKFRSSETQSPKTVSCIRFLKFFLSTTTILLAASLLVAALVGITSYKVAISNIEKFPSIGAYAPDFAAVSASILNLMFIICFKKVYFWLSKKLTDLESHKTDKEFEDAFAVKIYLFQFVNCYSSIFYAGFIQRLSNQNYISFIEPCRGDNCYADLCIQLAIILIGKQMIGNISEHLMPSIYYCLKKNCSLKRKRLLSFKKEQKLEPQWEKDYLRFEWKNISIHNEYLEMILQYGFIAMFVAAFPLAPIFALLNNLMEIRIDANKFVVQMRRPLAQRARDIGIWLDILIYISKISTITNAFIIAFTSDYIPRKIYLLETRDSNFTGYISSILKQKTIQIGNSTVNCNYRDFGGIAAGYNDQEKLISYKILVGRLAFVVIYEHLTIVCGFLLNRMIKELPTVVKNQIEKENSVVQQAIWQDKTPSKHDDSGGSVNTDHSSVSNLSGASLSIPETIETMHYIDQHLEDVITFPVACSAEEEKEAF